jgi:hypothetical protein
MYAMENKGKQFFGNMPSKGSLIGALIGALLSFKYHNQADRPIKNAGKTALFSGTGFLLGQWLEKTLKKRNV